MHTALMQSHPNNGHSRTATLSPNLYTVRVSPGEELPAAIARHRRSTGWRGGLVIVPTSRN